MKILYTTDLHGDELKYKAILNIAQEENIAITINGGDMLPKLGDLFKIQKQFIEDFLPQHLRAFEDAGIQYLFCPGNDDLKIYDSELEKISDQFPGINSVKGKLVEIEEFSYIGTDLVIDYPFRLKDRCRMDTKDFVSPRQLGSAILSRSGSGKYTEIDNWQDYANSLPTLDEELQKLPEPEDYKSSIFIIHMPPSRLGLDVCYDGRKVGSKAVYNFLQNKQPLLSLHGHIHESPAMSGVWKANIENTTCIQPGQGLPGKLVYVIIDLDSMDIKRSEV